MKAITRISEQALKKSEMFFGNNFLVQQKLAFSAQLQCVMTRDCYYRQKAKVSSALQPYFNGKLVKKVHFGWKLSIWRHGYEQQLFALAQQAGAFRKTPLFGYSVKKISDPFHTCLGDEITTARFTDAHEQLTIQTLRIYLNPLQDHESKKNCVYNLDFCATYLLLLNSTCQ